MPGRGDCGSQRGRVIIDEDTARRAVRRRLCGGGPLAAQRTCARCALRYLPVATWRSVYARALVATPPTPRRAALRGASPSSCHSAALGLRGVSVAT